MDSALLAEREAFKRKAMAVPVLENKKKKVEKDSPKKPVKPETKKPVLTDQERLARMKAMGASSQYKVTQALLALLQEVTYFNLALSPVRCAGEDSEAHAEQAHGRRGPPTHVSPSHIFPT